MSGWALVETGGTIGASSASHGAELGCSWAKGDWEITRSPFSIFSEDATPEHWVQLAQEVEALPSNLRGCVILHGTDTMSYTTAYLSFALRPRWPIVFIGSNTPGGDRNSGVAEAIRRAKLAGEHLPPGVFLFEATLEGGTVWAGSRLRKIRYGSGATWTGADPIGVIEKQTWKSLRWPHPPAAKTRLGWQPVHWLRLAPGISLPELRPGPLLLELYPSGTAPESLWEWLQIQSAQRDIYSVTPDGGTCSSAYPSWNMLRQTTTILPLLPETAWVKLGWAEATDPQLMREDVAGESYPTERAKFASAE